MASPAPNLEISDASLSLREDGLRRRVLYAEDQASARTVTTALLERMGFEVMAVEDGELALELAKQQAYDLILLDIEMPVMDGVTAARHIRSDAQLCRGVPILALSAFLADSTEHCQWRGAFDSALPKPANSNELKKAVRKLLASKVAASAKGIATPRWSEFSRQLSPGTVASLVKTVHAEMHQLINGIAACTEAGDATGAAICRKGLNTLGLSFEAPEIMVLLADPNEESTALLIRASDTWRARQTRH
jgi:CheY-like chemotaxis protein